MKNFKSLFLAAAAGVALFGSAGAEGSSGMPEESSGSSTMTYVAAGAGAIGAVAGIYGAYKAHDVSSRLDKLGSGSGSAGGSSEDFSGLKAQGEALKEEVGTLRGRFDFLIYGQEELDEWLNEKTEAIQGLEQALSELGKESPQLSADDAPGKDKEKLSKELKTQAEALGKELRDKFEEIKWLGKKFSQRQNVKDLVKNIEGIFDIKTGDDFSDDEGDDSPEEEGEEF